MVRVNRISIWDFYISVLNFHSLHLWQTPPLPPPSRALYSVWSILLLLLLLWIEGENKQKNYELLGLWSFDNRNLQVSKSVKIRMRSGDSYRFKSYPPILPPSSFHVSLCTCLKHFEFDISYIAVECLPLSTEWLVCLLFHYNSYNNVSHVISPSLEFIYTVLLLTQQSMTCIHM